MAQVALPRVSSFILAGFPLLRAAGVLIPLLLVAGCASLHTPSSLPPEVSPTAVAARVLIPADLEVNPAETVVKLPPADGARLGPPTTFDHELQPATFALPDAIGFALQNNPKLRSARAAVG